MDIKESIKMAKLASTDLASSSGEDRNDALRKVANALRSGCDAVFAANKLDVEAARAENLSDSVIKRLKFDEHKLEGVLDGISQLIQLPDPIGKKLLSRELDKDLCLYRLSCPIGVLGVIFEARPDALVQISTLCIKSGNCAVLKGGSETARTNKALFELITGALKESRLPSNCLLQIEERSQVKELLSCSGDIDLIIPRGSNSFVQYIMANTTIPVMGHADGVCHIYVSSHADKQMALDITLDAKTQYTSVCNAVETILIDKKIANDFIPAFYKQMTDAHVTLHGNREFADTLKALCPDSECILMDDSEYHKEYLDYECSVKLVDSLDEAVKHINTFGSHHSDCIITKDNDEAERFMNTVDSANVMYNCSTRFSDGYRYGFGAEVGISTSKLHARGPVGLEGLMTYKYKLYGSGQKVADYVNGTRKFHFKDL